MKLHDVQQGSDEWLALRLGIPTASEFSRIVTPKGDLSKAETSRGYAIRLVTEALLNRTLDSIDNLEWVQRGKQLEPEAARAYEFQEGVETVPVGFITTDDGRMGASPDRLVGEVGLLEIKCPAPQTHVAYLLDGYDRKYHPQVQGQLLIAEREWTDWWSYSQEMPPVPVRTVRDEPYIRKLRAALDEFCDLKDELLERARAAGMFATRANVETATDRAYGDGNLHTILVPGTEQGDNWVPG